MDPGTVEGWLQIALARKRDAEHIKNADASSIGAAYLSGFAVECTLKAALKKKKIKIPKGKNGHDLRNMASLLDIPFQSVGGAAWFLDEWTVDLRYAEEGSLDKSVHDYVLASMKVKSYLDKYINRLDRRRR